MKKAMMKGRKEQTEKIGSTHLMEDKVEPGECAQHSVHRGDDQVHRGDDQELSLTWPSRAHTSGSVLERNALRGRRK